MQLTNEIASEKNVSEEKKTYVPVSIGVEKKKDGMDHNVEKATPTVSYENKFKEIYQKVIDTIEHY